MLLKDYYDMNSKRLGFSAGIGFLLCIVVLAISGNLINAQNAVFDISVSGRITLCLMLILFAYLTSPFWMYSSRDKCVLSAMYNHRSSNGMYPYRTILRNFIEHRGAIGVFDEAHYQQDKEAFEDLIRRGYMMLESKGHSAEEDGFAQASSHVFRLDPIIWDKVNKHPKWRSYVN